jgi:hypothetical protein
VLYLQHGAGELKPDGLAKETLYLDNLISSGRCNR